MELTLAAEWGERLKSLEIARRLGVEADEFYINGSRLHEKGLKLKEEAIRLMREGSALDKKAYRVREEWRKRIRTIDKAWKKAIKKKHGRKISITYKPVSEPLSLKWEYHLGNGEVYRPL